MSISQIQREINSLDGKINSLEKSRADIEKKEAVEYKKISDTEKSINKKTSTSTLRVKSKKIQDSKSKLAKYASDKAKINGDLASKKQSRTTKSLKLQKEQQSFNKKESNNLNALHKSYENQIHELTSQLRNSINATKQSGNNNGSENENEYDVFISHAWEDKESFVDDLAKELEKIGIRVWYDTKKIVWGDSMREKIENGLKKSRFGVVVISPNYISEEKYWTKSELDGLFQLESINGKLILPIWHNISKKEVIEYSPIIAGRKALNTTMNTPQEIAEELKEILNIDDKE